MRPDDDDEEAGLGPPPDPSLRAWRHPSEIAAAAAAAARYADESPQFTPLDPSGHDDPRPLRGFALATSVALALAAVAVVMTGFGLTAMNSGEITAGGDGPPAPKASARSLLTSELAATGLAPALTRPSSSTVTAISAPAVDDTPGSANRTAPTATSLAPRTATAPESATRPKPPVEPAVFGVSAGTSTRLAAFAVIDRMVFTSASRLVGHDELTLVFDGRSVPATIVGVDPVTDIAVLAPADATGEDLVRAVAEADPARTTVEAVVVADGQTARAANGQHLFGLLLTSTPCPDGIGGAAVVNDHGELVGLAVDSRSPLLHVVSAAEVSRIGESLTASGTASPIWLGVDGDTGTSGVARVAKVTAHGPGAAAGLQPGDDVTAVDGVPVLEWHHLIHLLRDAGPGATVTLTVTRAGTVVELDVTIGTRSDGGT